jgi:hypothetical protein
MPGQELTMPGVIVSVPVGLDFEFKQLMRAFRAVSSARQPLSR